MASQKYAQETSRTVTGGLTERTFGPSSPRSRRMARGLRLTMYRTVGMWRPTSRGIRLARRAFDPGATMPPIRGTRFQRRVIGGVPVEWSMAPRAAGEGAPDRVILYLHGGGFVVGSPRTHRNIVSRLSQITSTAVASVDYRMAPEASIQASRADAFAVYKGLLESGYSGEGIVVAGDSAGGNLALYVTLAAALNHLETPSALALLSPWLDLTTGGPSRVSNAGTEFFIGGTVLDRIARVLVPDDEERHYWFNSPINAPEQLLEQIPPTLIQVGGAEVLADDGIEMARRMGAAGAKHVELQTYDDQGHVVALWAGTPEARKAMDELGRFLRAAFPRRIRPSPPSEAELEEATEATSPTDAPIEGFPG